MHDAHKLPPLKNLGTDVALLVILHATFGQLVERCISCDKVRDAHLRRHSHLHRRRRTSAHRVILVHKNVLLEQLRPADMTGSAIPMCTPRQAGTQAGTHARMRARTPNTHARTVAAQFVCLLPSVPLRCRELGCRRAAGTRAKGRGTREGPSRRQIPALPHRSAHP